MRAKTSNTVFATLLPKKDRHGIGMLASMSYDMLKRGEKIDLNNRP